MVALLDPEGVDGAVELLDGFGIRAWVAGEVSTPTSADAGAGGAVELVGQHPGW
jgi:phosphoribosylformylglycinamidine cyclo-ligase